MRSEALDGVAVEQGAGSFIFRVDLFDYTIEVVAAVTEIAAKNSSMSGKDGGH